MQMNDPTERDDAQLIRSIKDGYAAPELNPNQRAAIDRRVWERVERHRSYGLMTAVALSGALAVGLFVMVRADHTATEPSAEPAKIASVPPARPATVASVPAARAASDSAWAEALLFDPAGESGSQARSDDLPDEYRAITDVLLDGDDA
jgi:hypothetical protein